jgi:hypothetical protein
MLMTDHLATSPNQAKSNKAAQAVRDSRDDALQMMTKAGFKIGQNVQVAVDPQLPFMGYTMPLESGFRIVVSGGSVGSEMLNGLLIHEMSHIYRIQSRHPSHNAEILEEAINRIGKTNLRYEYQQKIIHDLLNDIQDLYADDIAFQVFRMNPKTIPDQITGFLQSWVKEEPVRSADATKDRWINASIMVHNARAVAQMKRHHVEDVDNIAAKASQKFLSQLPVDMTNKFDFFRTRLESLKESMTEEEYRTLLAEYLKTFLGIVEKS